MLHHFLCPNKLISCFSTEEPDLSETTDLLNIVEIFENVDKGNLKPCLKRDMWFRHIADNWHRHECYAKQTGDKRGTENESKDEGNSEYVGHLVAPECVNTATTVILNVQHLQTRISHHCSVLPSSHITHTKLSFSTSDSITGGTDEWLNDEFIKLMMRVL